MKRGTVRLRSGPVVLVAGALEQLTPAIEAAGIDPVLQTYQGTWPSQLFVLADFHNVAAAEPTFADDYTANKVEYATSPVAVEGFGHLQEVHEAGYQNADFASTGLNDGLRKLAAGEGRPATTCCSWTSC